MKIKLLFAAIWIACSVLSWGILYGDISAYFFPRYKTEHTGICTLLSVGGPISLVGAILATDFAHRGIRFESRYTQRKREESNEIHHPPSARKE